MEKQIIENEGEQEPIVLPDYGQIQGEKVKLSGLDYSLIKQQTVSERKQQMMLKIKNKLNSMVTHIPVINNSQDKHKNSNNDQLTRNIVNAKTVMPNIDGSTFYLFPLESHFSPALPQLITRRFGKMHFSPLYLHHETSQIEQLRSLLLKDDRIKQNRQQRQKETAKVFSDMEYDSDSDDIFGCDDEQKGKQKGISIKIGNKLTFGIDDKDIFGAKVYKQVQEKVNQEAVQVQQKDKYQFLRKKAKKNEQMDYGQCYPQTGPSLQEMKEYRKEGIELFGEQKVRVEKQRKYDINKDYQKVKRIMQQKAKQKK